MEYKVKLNDEIIYSLVQWQTDMLSYSEDLEKLNADVKAIVLLTLQIRYNRAYNKFYSDWKDALSSDPTVTSIPINDQAFVEMILARPDYHILLESLPSAE